jgi:hypothetical protein
MSSNAFRKLPPDVRRELLRHVKPSNSQTQTKLNSDRIRRNHENLEAVGNNRSNSAKKWLLGCVGFVGCAASIPYWATQKIGNLTARDDPLSAGTVRRGAFNNSGSKDAGKDKNWINGLYVYPKGLEEHLKKQDPNETDLGPDIGPMVQAEKKAKQQKQ